MAKSTKETKGNESKELDIKPIEVGDEMVKLDDTESMESYSVELNLKQLIETPSSITKSNTETFSSRIYLKLLSGWIDRLKKVTYEATTATEDEDNVLSLNVSENSIVGLCRTFINILTNLRELYLVDVSSLQELLDQIKYLDEYSNSIIENTNYTSYFVLCDVLDMIATFSHNGIRDIDNIKYLEKDMNTVKTILSTVESIDEFIEVLDNESCIPTILDTVYTYTHKSTDGVNSSEEISKLQNVMDARSEFTEAIRDYIK